MTYMPVPDVVFRPSEGPCAKRRRVATTRGGAAVGSLRAGQELRDADAVLDEIRADGTYKGFRDALLAITGATQPTIAPATAAADFAMVLVARILKMNRDDQLIYIAGSFDDAFDDLGVKHGLVPHKNRYAKVSYPVAQRHEIQTKRASWPCAPLQAQRACRFRISCTTSSGLLLSMGGWPHVRFRPPRIT
jgi:hypothetical protein